jgi:hypothetical protein
MWQFSDDFDAELGTYYKQAYRRRGLAIPYVTGLPPVLAKRTAPGFASAAWRVIRRLRS